FPAFRGTESEIERLNVKKVTSRILNRSLREIGEKLGFNVKLTLNLARHSFATKLNIDGVNTSVIKDALGHSSAKTTEHYMKTLPIDNYRKISDNLLNFKKDN
ncbi:MAG: tyrosine-type recombinase/integrase, partial [Bacteroidetes bacterium]|nr:tyrosine-type recombinase/integrase [Bacteroidota bacterium]